MTKKKIGKSKKGGISSLFTNPLSSKVIVLGFVLYAMPATAAASTPLGTTDSYIDDLVAEYERGAGTVTLKADAKTSFTIDVNSYSYENGYLTFGGNVAGMPNTNVMMKGSRKRVYGWIHFIKEKTAYKYTSDTTGNVSVSHVAESEIISVDHFRPPTADRPSNPYGQRQDFPDVIHLGPMPSGTDLNDLQSKPESQFVVWMDIREHMDGNDPIFFEPEEMWITWQITASGLSAFDVNVTTSKAVYDAASSSNRGYGYFDPAEGRAYCYMDAFGSDSQGCHLFRETNGDRLGRTTIHEFGHLLGVNDYGHVEQGTYFEGLPEFQWVPTMGNFWFGNSWEEALYQWCKGEYEGATVTTDFYAAASRNVDIAPDDIPTSIPLVIEGDTVVMKDNFGIINIPDPDYDEDDFTFEIKSGSGEVDLRVERIEHIGAAMLDAHASILDDAGQVIVEDNPKAARYSDLKTTLEAGSYTLRVAGGEEGTPKNGFSRYGSVGYYVITGTVTGAGDADSDADSDTDSDGDADSDTDGDSDADTDSDSDSDADGDADGDSDGDGDGDADGDADADDDDNDDSDSSSQPDDGGCTCSAAGNSPVQTVLAGLLASFL